MDPKSCWPCGSGPSIIFITECPRHFLSTPLQRPLKQSVLKSLQIQLGALSSDSFLYNSKRLLSFTILQLNLKHKNSIAWKKGVSSLFVKMKTKFQLYETLVRVVTHLNLPLKKNIGWKWGSSEWQWWHLSVKIPSAMFHWCSNDLMNWSQCAHLFVITPERAAIQQ